MRNFYFTLLAYLFSTLSANAQIIYVNDSATGIGNGKTWADAYNKLQDALSRAKNGDEIWIARGTYKPTLSNDRSASFILPSGVKLCGGFLGNETSKSSRNLLTNVTTLTGNVGLSNDVGDNSIHVVIAVNCDSNTTLDGITISDGVANINDSSIVKGCKIYSNKGSGLYAYGGQLKVINCNFRTGTATYYGGGVFLTKDTTILKNCVFIGNNCYNGAGCATDSSTASFDSCKFIENLASTFDGMGGGVNNSHSSITLSNCEFVANKATRGGGIYNWYGNLIIKNCSMMSNVSYQGTWGFAHGGGMHSYRCNIVINASNFKKNVSFARNNMGLGGAISNDGGKFKIMNSVFDSNSAGGQGYTYFSGSGGAIRNRYDTSYVYNCLFVNNHTYAPNMSYGDGGSVACTGDNNLYSIYSNCTFTTDFAVPGNYHVYGITGLYNSIIWNAGSFSPMYSAPADDIRNCIWQDVVPDVSRKIFNSNPLFKDSANHDYSLLSCSPGVNTGNDSLYIGFLTTDKDLSQLNRLIGGNIDIGAYESQFGKPTVKTGLLDAQSCNLSDTAFSILVEGEISTYRWQIKKKGSLSFIDTIGNFTNRFPITNPDTSMNGWEFRVIVSNCAATLSDTSNAASLRMQSLVLPTIKRNGDTLRVEDIYKQYQWYKDSIPMPSHINDLITLSTDGEYYIMVVDSNGCVGYSALQIVNDLSIRLLNEVSPVQIYPNPVNDLLFVQSLDDYSIIIKNLQGLTVISADDSPQIDVKKLPKGLYVYLIYGNTGQLIGKGKLQKL